MNPVDIDERFAKLERENEVLRNKVAMIEERGGRKVLPAPPIEPVARVTYLIEESTFTMPPADELQRLAMIATGAYPGLANCDNMGLFRPSPEENRCEWNTQFELSFLALGAMKRLESPDRKHYASHHIDICETRLRVIGKSYTLRFNPWMAAVIAWGDIPHCGMDMQHEGVVVEVALSEFVGRVASDESWKRVLSTAGILSPSRGKIQMAPRSPSRVVAW